LASDPARLFTASISRYRAQIIEKRAKRHRRDVRLTG
jgi:hypothetical protein